MSTEPKNAWYLGDQLVPLIDMFAMLLNYMFKNILSIRIKYDDSRNRNKLVMRKILIVSFDFIKNNNSHLCLIFFRFE